MYILIPLLLLRRHCVFTQCFLLRTMGIVYAYRRGLRRCTTISLFSYFLSHWLSVGTQSVNFAAFSLGSYSEPTKREFGVGATNLVTFRHIFRVTRASGNIFAGEKKRWPLRKPRSIQKYSFICFRIYILRDEWTGWTVTFVLVSSYAQSATLALFFSSVTSLLLLLLLALLLPPFCLF